MAVFAPTDLGNRLAGWLRNDDLPAGNTRLSSSTTWNPPSSSGAFLPFWLPTGGTGGGPMVLDNRTPAGGKGLYVPQSETHTAVLANLLMNAPSSYVPWASTALGSDYNGFGPWMLANGTLNTNQSQTNGTSVTYGMRMLASTVVTSYTLYRHNSFPTYMPSAWTFEGSNNGSSWTTLDTQTTQNFNSVASRQYSFSNSTSYAYYRLVATAGNGGAQLIISEIELNAVANSALVWSECEVFFVMRSFNTGIDSPRAWEFGTSASQKHYWYLASQHYEDFGSSTRTVYNPTVSLNAWHVLNMRAFDAGGGNSQFTSTINGGLQFTSTAAAKGWQNNPSLYALNAEFAEMVVTRGALTALERAKMLGYLSGRHAISVTGAAYLDDTFPGLTIPPVRNLASTGNTTGYTTEASEPLTLPVAKTGWATWVCPNNGSYQIDTIGSAFDTGLAIYTGSTLAGLTLVASDNDSGGSSTSKLTFTATAGVTYRIQVGSGTGTTEGAVTLTITGTASAVPVSPTQYAAAGTVTGLLLKGRTTKANDAAAGG